MSELDKQIIALLVDGLTTKAIADKVNRSALYVRKRIDKLKKKYNCYNSTQLACKFLKNV